MEGVGIFCLSGFFKVFECLENESGIGNRLPAAHFDGDVNGFKHFFIRSPRLKGLAQMPFHARLALCHNRYRKRHQFFCLFAQRTILERLFLHLQERFVRLYVFQEPGMKIFPVDDALFDFFGLGPTSFFSN